MLWEGESAWLATLRDVSDRRLSERLLQARMALVDFSASHSVVEILQYALDEVGRFVSSPVGFYHLVAEDGHTLAERAWSTQTPSDSAQWVSPRFIVQLIRPVCGQTASN